jgi:hypothetical protein
MEGVHANTEMERILPARLRNVLVGADTRCLERFARELLVLVRHEMTAEGELVNGRSFPAKVKNPDLQYRLGDEYLFGVRVRRLDLGVGDTAVVPRFGIWLILAVTVASGRAASHFEL